MSNVTSIKREPSAAMLQLAEEMEELAARMRKGEVNAAACIEIGPKDVTWRFERDQDGVALLGAVRLLGDDMSEAMRGK